MPQVDVCKLCLRSLELRLSHFMPAALYPKGRKQTFTTPTSTGPIDKAREIRDYVLCSGCELRLDQGGESHVLGLVAAKVRRRFPLLERVGAVQPLRTRTDGRHVYSATSLGIDTGKLAYFALSIVWRASVHEWPVAGSPSLSPLSLSPFDELLRRYLLGETSFPLQTAVVAAICTDSLTRETWFVPTLDRDSIEGLAIAHLQTLGFNFTAWFGPSIPEEVSALCCVSSPEKTVIVANCEAVTQAMWNTLS